MIDKSIFNNCKSHYNEDMNMLNIIRIKFFVNIFFMNGLPSKHTLQNMLTHQILMEGETHEIGAGEEIRTLDILVGNEMLYH